MAYVIGIDGGTEGIRAHVFDLTGRPLASAVQAYDTTFPHPAWAEQDPEDWWAGLGTCVTGALAKAEITAGEIIALCVDTTCCSVVALDDNARPLRPAMIWMDVRAAKEAQSVAATGDGTLRINGDGSGAVSAEWMIPKALWIKNHQPEIYQRAAVICEYQDYINWRLTGRCVASLNNVSVRWHHQTGHGGPPASLLAALGLDDLAAKWPHEILKPGAVIATLSAEAAAHTGLPATTAVIQGGADAFIGMIGLGVTEPGEMALITGSSHLHLGIAGGPVHKPGVWGTYMDAVYPGKAIIEGGQTSTGSVINWFKTRFAAGTGYDELNALAAAIAPGADGLLALDHFQGNRTPYTDARSRGAITGLTLMHGPEHVFRAIIEAICLGTRLIIDNFGDSFDARRIVVAGGATNSPLWLQIHADTIGAPLVLTKVADAPALGCAILAATGAGEFSSIEEGTRAMVHAARTIEPDPATTAAYEPVYERYCRLYDALKGVREGVRAP